MARSKFGAQMRKATQAVERGLAQDIKAAFVTFASEVIQQTPVDKGFAKGSWQVGIGSVPNDDGQTDRSGQGAINQAQSAAASYKVGDVIYLSNNAPYIGKLEFGGYPNPSASQTGKTSGGFSIQAPAGMVRVNLPRYLENLRKITK